jgi:hypothetical protein
MKVRKRSILFAVVIYTATGLLGVLSSLAVAPTARADNPTFAFDYNPDPQTVTTMVNAAQAVQDNSAFQDSEVYAQGGIFGSGVQFTYERLVTGSPQTGGDYQYSYNYTCVDGVPQTQPAASNVDSYTVEASVFLTLGPEKPTFNNQPNIYGSNLYYITHVTFNGAQVPNQTIQSYPDAHNVGGIPSDDSNLSAMHFPSSCLAYPFTYGDHTTSAFRQPIPNLEDNPSAKTAWQAAITAAQGGSPGGSAPPATGPTAPTTDNQCASAAGAFGWFICPGINLADDTINTLVQQVIIPELDVTPLSASSTNSEYIVWESMRTLADVLFVLIFLVIIFANTLQFNINAYTIKKVIPRLVAAAILVQFSFILSALFVDIGNVLGQGISSLVHVVITAHSSAPAGANPTLYALGAAFDTVALIGAVAVIGVPTILVAALAGLISVIGVVFTLVARQLIITILVVVSPLAFAAFVLPNTDRYFSMWMKLFIRVALMYPLIMLLLSAAAIGENTVSGSSLEALLAVIFPIIAFFMIPMTFKWAGSAMSMAAGGINKVTNKANSSGAMKSMRTGARERQQRTNQNRAAGYQDTVFGRRVPGGRTVMTGLGRIGTGQVIPTNRTKSDIALKAQKAMAEESKRVEALNLDSAVLGALVSGDTAKLNPTQKASYDQNKSLAKTYTGRAAIANQLAKKSNVEGLDKFRDKLNKDVAAKRITEPQATQLWNGAKAGAFSEIKARDPIMAASGWANKEYDGTINPDTGRSYVQDSMSRLSGEDISKTAPSRLQAYADAKATMSAGQLASATSDQARQGKGTDHQLALLKIADNGSAATDRDVQLEKHIRFDYSSGTAVARGDTEVREIKRKMATDATYSQDVRNAVDGNIAHSAAGHGAYAPIPHP